MRYKNITPARFIDRPNRFTAHVDLNGQTETVHVKNTGRGTGVLVPGALVYLTEPGTPGRKTRYDLVAARRDNGFLINIDSQAPNNIHRILTGSFRNIPMEIPASIFIWSGEEGVS